MADDKTILLATAGEAQLWCMVYAAAIHSGHGSLSASMADTAVRELRERGGA